MIPHGLYPPGSSVRGDYPGKNTGVGCNALLQGIFPTQGSNPGLPHYRQILYCLSHKGSPRILEWVAYPFSRWIVAGLVLTQESLGSPSGRFFTSWATNGGPSASEKSKLVYLHSNSSISTLSSTRGRYLLPVQKGILQYRQAIPKLYISDFYRNLSPRDKEKKFCSQVETNPVLEEMGKIHRNL